jgi:hypothetical protein
MEQLSNAVPQIRTKKLLMRILSSSLIIAGTFIVA